MASPIQVHLVNQVMMVRMDWKGSKDCVDLRVPQVKMVNEAVVTIVLVNSFLFLFRVNFFFHINNTGNSKNGNNWE
uniref:Uncharacterized protein n=1 Tax=Brugia timori TaxID=42155 RepID=A0A0R3QCN1_9BILA